MDNYIKISFRNISPKQKEILIAQLISTGYEGFEEANSHLFAFIPEKNFSDRLITEIAAIDSLYFTREIIIQQNWNEEWEKNFQPVFVDDFCAIRAAFNSSGRNVNYEIVITPK